MFNKKTWVDRVSEYPTRRTLTDTSGTVTTVTVARSEGTVSKEGDAFSAANMNDLEDRINAALGGYNIVVVDSEDDIPNPPVETTIYLVKA